MVACSACDLQRQQAAAAAAAETRLVLPSRAGRSMQAQLSSVRTCVVTLLHAAGLLVGRSHECDYPQSIQHLPALTSAHNEFTSSAQMNDAVAMSLGEGCLRADPASNALLLIRQATGSCIERMQREEKACMRWMQRPWQPCSLMWW